MFLWFNALAFREFSLLRMPLCMLSRLLVFTPGLPPRDHRSTLDSFNKGTAERHLCIIFSSSIYQDPCVFLYMGSSLLSFTPSFAISDSAGNLSLLLCCQSCKIKMNMSWWEQRMEGYSFKVTCLNVKGQGVELWWYMWCQHAAT